MSRYPDETTRRFDQQFAETEGERNARLRKKRLAATPKAWNGGSIESAMEYARQNREKAIQQGASRCDECGGEGGSQVSGVCIQCHGAGFLLPPGGLQRQP